MAAGEGAFRTSDMALATTLSLHGYTAILEWDLERERAVWVFPLPLHDGKLHDIVAEYRTNHLKVSPRQFMLELVSVRTVLYAFIREVRATANS
jgi:hypothetical protein